MLKKILGYSILVSLAIALYIVLSLIFGFIVTLIMFAAAIGITALIIFAINLIT